MAWVLTIAWIYVFIGGLVAIDAWGESNLPAWKNAIAAIAVTIAWPAVARGVGARRRSRDEGPSHGRRDPQRDRGREDDDVGMEDRVMAIHLRDPRTPLIQFKTLCGLYIAQMPPTEVWTYERNNVDCKNCECYIDEHIERMNDVLKRIDKHGEKTK